MRALIVSTYELGHQPVHAASPAAALQAAGHEVRALDLAVEMWDPDLLDGIDALAFSVPMHTAMRIAVSAAQAARRTHPDVPVCFYGLYGEMAPALDPSHPMDRALAGEYEPELVAWVDALAGANGAADLSPTSSSSPSTPITPRRASCCRRSTATRGLPLTARSDWRATSRPATAACTSAATVRCRWFTTVAFASSGPTR